MYLPCKASQAAAALSLEAYYRAKGSSQQSVSDIETGPVLRSRTWSQMLLDVVREFDSGWNGAIAQCGLCQRIGDSGDFV